MPHFSIIVPVYNTERYLEDCVKSVLMQSFSDYELLLINDGSTDGSGLLCDQFSESDSRIKVFHKENEGQSRARNLGMDKACGEYLLFLDSDDYYINEAMLDELSRYGTDLVCFSYCLVDEKKNILNKKVINFDKTLSGNAEEATRLLVKNNVFIPSPGTKAIRKRYLMQNDLYFSIGRINEDAEWSGRIILSEKTIEYINKPFYAYRMRNGSTTQIIKQKNIDDLIWGIESLINYSKEKSELLAQALSSYLSVRYAVLLTLVRLGNKNNLKENLQTSKQYFYLLKSSDSIIIKLLWLVGRIFSLRFCSFLLYIRYKLKNVLQTLKLRIKK